MEKTGMKTGMKTGDAIIALIEENPFISHDALAERLMKARSSIIEQVSKLKASGRIRRVGPDKGGALGSREVMAERGIVVGSERI